MRSLLQCVCCCKPTKRTHLAGDDEEEPPSSASASRAEATQLLIPPGALIRRQRKRRGLGAPAADWRPSLFAIAEETSVRVAPPYNSRFVESPTNLDFKRRRCFSARVDAPTLLSQFEREDHQMSVQSLSAAAAAAPFMMF